MNKKTFLANTRLAAGSLAAAILMLTAVAMPSFAIPPALQDQNGKTGGMDDFSGKPVVVFVTSLTQLANLGKWEEAIRPEVPNINSLDIGDINKAPGFVRSAVVKELEKHVPENVSVYIDDDNLWQKEYQLDLGEPCVLIFDAEHNLVDQFSGKPKGQTLDDAIAAARKQFPAADASPSS